MHLITNFLHFNLWAMLTFLACVAMVVRLLTFRRHDSRHRAFYAWMAWVWVVSFTMTVVKLLCGIQPPPGPVQAIATWLLFGLLAFHRGNLAHLVRWPLSIIARIHRSTRR
jgi:predicted membrane channel-forming protein YqfA (hemolysin III family)